MSSIDELFMELYKDDPEEYQKMLEEQKKTRVEIEEQMYNKRRQTAGLLLEPTSVAVQKRIDLLTEKELVRHFAVLKHTADAVEKRYHRLMDETLYNVSKTTFKEVVMRSNWTDVAESIVTLFHDQEEHLEGYHAVYRQLKDLTPSVNEEGMVLCVRSDEEDDRVCDVFGKMPTQMESYALEFSPWEDWLGYYCEHACIDAKGDAAFIASCLWEMTFDGFDQESIQKKADKLFSQAEDE